MIWLTLDVEEVTDMNFHVQWKEEPELDYEKYVDAFIDFSKNYKATAFVLGSFAKKYPHIVQKLSQSGIEIACHGLYHNLVYTEDFVTWSNNVREAKSILEELICEPVFGYRSPSWSMPFEKKYYAELARLGFEYSSSYFPMKNYMYGNCIDKKHPCSIYTEYGNVEERPITKNIIPFSGGFYLRILPLWLLKILFKKTKNPILYVHPYELINENLLFYFKNYAGYNLDYFLAFYASSYARDKIKALLNEK
jgi:peptidoglycan/xylan/chitin deacetylase (PgdA/CDA1 family)